MFRKPKKAIVAIWIISLFSALKISHIIASIGFKANFKPFFWTDVSMVSYYCEEQKIKP